MKNIICLALLSVVAAVPFLQASAQEKRQTVNIPFTFHVGQATLPAGAYTIASDSSRRVINITSQNPNVHAGALAMNDVYGTGRGNLVIFHRYGNQYFLHRIVQSDARNAMFLAPSKAEKQARRQTELAGIPLQDPVVLAMNDNPASFSGVESSQ
jgi:hypothetical protein